MSDFIPLNDNVAKTLNNDALSAVVCSNCLAMTLHIHNHYLELIKEHENGEEFEAGGCAFSTFELFEKVRDISETQASYKVSPDYFAMLNNPAVYIEEIGTECPCCGRKYNHDDLYKKSFTLLDHKYFQDHIYCIYNSGVLKKHISHRNYFLEQVIPEYSRIKELCKAGMVYPEVVGSVEGDVPRFIKSLIDVETTIEFLHKRLKQLCRLSVFPAYDEEDSKKMFGGTVAPEFFLRMERNRLFVATELVHKKKKLLKELAKLDQAMEFDEDSIDYALYGLTKPVQPTRLANSCPVKPVEPLYEKPGLLNKTKVNANNEKKRYEYNVALNEYESKYAEWLLASKDFETAMQQFQIEQEKYQKKRQEILKEEREKFESQKSLIDTDKEREKLKSELLDVESALLNVENAARERGLTSKEKVIINVINNEIEQVVELLKKAYGTREKLHSMNVIFEKYTNVVALTTIYEYYQTGRVTELTGPNGAYNLYESELRTNIIIDKLDKIIAKLESIKSNQYTLYQEMTKINESINTLGNKTIKMLTEISENTKIAADNSVIIAENSAITAYNTSVSAFYSKKNSELLDSLGYLIAFN